MPRTWFIRALLLCLLAIAMQAHIGSPDIYLDGSAGPYRLFVTVRPPLVIPGVAELEIRSESPGVQKIQAVPLPMSGPGAQFAPLPDQLAVSPQDKQLFTGSLWMMAPGSWQVRLTVAGERGAGVVSIPIPSAARSTKRMQFGLGLVLTLLGTFLVGGVVVMVGASVRESRLDPGTTPSPQRVHAGRLGMAAAFLVVAVVLWGANRWWNNEATSYGQEVYKPLQMQANVNSSGLLTLHLTDPGWLDGPGWSTLFTRSVSDFVPDHNHLMHLYVIRQPGLDLIYHLHPDQSGTGIFQLSLPHMPAGTYRLYADVVHANGFPETLVSSIAVPSIAGRSLAGDDATGVAVPISQVQSTSSEFRLPDGYRMQWVLPPNGLHPKRPTLFRFRLLRPDGSTPADMALYMGMLGHAAFVKTDGSVFAHLHPTGSVSMAAFMLAQQPLAAPQAMAGMDMSTAGSTAPAELPNAVQFPYGFPSAGPYRIFVQMKHGQAVETGIFDAFVR